MTVVPLLALLFAAPAGPVDGGPGGGFVVTGAVVDAAGEPVGGGTVRAVSEDFFSPAGPGRGVVGPRWGRAGGSVWGACRRSGGGSADG